MMMRERERAREKAARARRVGQDAAVCAAVPVWVCVVATVAVARASRETNRPATVAGRAIDPEGDAACTVGYLLAGLLFIRKKMFT